MLKLVNKIRPFILVAGITLLIINFLRINPEDWSWDENSGAYLGIISNSLIIVAMIISLRYSKMKSRS